MRSGDGDMRKDIPMAISTFYGGKIDTLKNSTLYDGQEMALQTLGL